MPKSATATPASSSSRLWKRLAVLAGLLCAVVMGYLLLGDVLTLDTLARHERRLREMHQRNPVVGYAVAFLIYVLITGISLPASTALTLAYGWFFGLLRGTILVSFASTTGATVAFLLSRYLFRDTVQQRFANRLQRFNRAWERDGPYFFFLLRVSAVVPYFIINAAMGLTPIRTATFWWISQLGMLPATLLVVYVGSSVPSLEELAEKGMGAVVSTGQLVRLFSALVLVGMFPLAVRWTIRYGMRRSQV